MKLHSTPESATWALPSLYSMCRVSQRVVENFIYLMLNISKNIFEEQIKHGVVCIMAIDSQGELGQKGCKLKLYASLLYMFTTEVAG